MTAGTVCKALVIRVINFETVSKVGCNGEGRVARPVRCAVCDVRDSRRDWTHSAAGRGCCTWGCTSLGSSGGATSPPPDFVMSDQYISANAYGSSSSFTTLECEWYWWLQISATYHPTAKSGRYPRPVLGSLAFRHKLAPRPADDPTEPGAGTSLARPLLAPPLAHPTHALGVYSPCTSAPKQRVSTGVSIARVMAVYGSKYASAHEQQNNARALTDVRHLPPRMSTRFIAEFRAA
ncbi:hypothetical protein EVAR_69325_1 [Eumeta japonica]|uniref:Uncharacterized protein n=1 Tax=Eumeta variegata TaxID=151549 RepID=A0A4C2A566_EUMVA|nr:hypothetical protein EVAR_69325_1 [Eumeta japonica]